MTAAQIMDVIAKLPDCERQEMDAISAYIQVKMEDAPRLHKIPESECPRMTTPSNGSRKGGSFGQTWAWQCCSNRFVFLIQEDPRKLESRSVTTVDELMLKGKWERDESVSQILSDRENLHRGLVRTAESATRGENEAKRKLSEMKWKMEDGSKGVRKSLFTNPIENKNLKDSSLIKRIYGQTLLTEKEFICVENGKWGNTLFQESRTKDCWEFEELRNRCYEVSDKARQTKLDGLSMKQQRNPHTVSQLLAQKRELQNKVKFLVWCKRFSWSWNSEQLWCVPRYWSTSNSSEYQNSAWPRFWIAAYYAENSGNLRKHFWTTTCSTRTSWRLFRKFKEFGIIFSRSVTRIHRRKYDARIEDETWATRLTQFENYSSQWRWYYTFFWWNFFGRPEHDRISETRLFSRSRRPKKLASSSASTIDDLMLIEKRDRDWSSKLVGKTTNSENPLQGGIRS